MRQAGRALGRGSARIRTALLFPFLLIPSPAFSAEWHVTPIRLDLGREARSGVITVVNDRPEKLRVQMSAKEWVQDAEGKDRYEDTADLLFFPKIIAFEKAEERIIRAGIRVPAAAREKTYRLFIEEIPEPRKAEGASVAIAVRFGVPVFVAPLKPEPSGTLDNVTVAGGRAAATVRNTGNVHFVVRAVVVKGLDAGGKELFAKEIAGWYLLAGASRVYAADIPAEACRAVRKVTVEARTDRMTLAGTVDADPAACPP